MIALFYTSTPDEALRFGDVVRGYVSATPIIEDPFVGSDFGRFKIEIDRPAFSVILFPSCSIRNKTVSLTPLLPARKVFFDNPNLASNLTAINLEMELEEAIPPDAWKSLSEDEKQAKRAQGRAYVFPSLFVYEKHDLLPEYEIHRQGGNIKTNYYMIDFSNVYKLGCEGIKDPRNSPLYSKCLQLSEQTRLELLYKIVGYFNRVSKEGVAGAEV